MATLYEALMRQVASFGFVVAAYRSCFLSSFEFGCDKGRASFMEILKIIKYFYFENLHAAPVDASKWVTISGHSTGARAALMAASVKDSPTYLDNTKYVEELSRLRAAAAVIGAVVAVNPDPMYLEDRNPDVPRFKGAVQAPTLVMTGSGDTLEPDGAAWWDFEMVAARSKAYLDIDEEWHTGVLFDHKAGPWVALWGQAFALGNETALALLYGDGPASMRRVLPLSHPGDVNTGNSIVSLLLCRSSEGHHQLYGDWPHAYAAWCKYDATVQPPRR
jgi:hypothetical protein